MTCSGEHRGACCVPAYPSILERRISPVLSYIVRLLAIGSLLFGIGAAHAADWRGEIGTFRVGIVASNAPTADGLAALRQSYSAALGMPVELFIARDFAMLIDAQATSRVEYAIYSASAYATVVELCQCVEAMAAPIDVDGASGIRSILIARRTKLNSLADLPKVKLVAPARDDLSGWLAPLSLLSREGLALRGDEAFITRTATVLEAETLFAEGGADALLGWERVKPDGEPLFQGGTADRLRRAGIDVDDLAQLWNSPTIPYGPHAVLKTLAPEAKAILSTFLRTLHSSNPRAYDLLSGGHAGGFATVEDSIYAPVREIVRAAAATEP